MCCFTKVSLGSKELIIDLMEVRSGVEITTEEVSEDVSDCVDSCKFFHAITRSGSRGVFRDLSNERVQGRVVLESDISD